MLSKEIILETLKTIQRERVIATPEVYAKTFCAVAKKAGLDLEECKPALKHIARLPEALKTQAADRRITQIDDLLAFLIGAIQRGGGANKKESGEIAASLIDLIAKAMTPSFSEFDTKKLSKTMEALEENPRLVLDKTWQKRIIALIAERIRYDRLRIANEANELNVGVDNLRDLIVAMRSATKAKQGDLNAFSQSLGQIKSERLSKETFAELKNRLTTLASELGEETESFGARLEAQEAEIARLKARIAAMSDKMERLAKENAEDYLTRVRNKRALDLALLEREEGYEKSHTDYAVLFFDVDLFKRINDDYGHECGDKVLQALGELMQSAMPKGGVIGRYGGEEFVALIGDSAFSAAVAIAENIRAEVEKSRFSYRSQTIAVTISCGVAFRSEALGIDDVIREADARLYAAKKGGRNRVASKKS
jgi:diguanylate cyclase (GGDEF)-like protein